MIYTTPLFAVPCLARGTLLACCSALLLCASASTPPVPAQRAVVSPELRSVRLVAPSVVGGVETVGMVTLAGRAPARGLLLQLRSSDPALAAVPPTVTVPEGRKIVMI